MVKSYYFPWGEIVFKLYIFSVLGKNLNYQGNNLIFNKIIGGQIVECMYDVWCSPGLGKKIWFSKCKIIFFSLRRHSSICISIIYLFFIGEKVWFSRRKIYKFIFFREKIWFYWRQIYKFSLFREKNLIFLKEVIFLSLN